MEDKFKPENSTTICLPKKYFDLLLYCAVTCSHWVESKGKSLPFPDNLTQEELDSADKITYYHRGLSYLYDHCLSYKSMHDIPSCYRTMLHQYPLRRVKEIMDIASNKKDSCYVVYIHKI